MHTHIRKMTSDDTEKVRQIYTSGWQNAFRGIVPQAYLDNLNLNGWTPPLAGAYVITDEEKILGTSSISSARDEDFQGWGEIISIYVLPEVIGQGCGHLLFEFVKEKLLELNYAQIYLKVFEENFRARKFYEQHGFSWNNQRLLVKIAGKDIIELRYVFQK